MGGLLFIHSIGLFYILFVFLINQTKMIDFDDKLIFSFRFYTLPRVWTEPAILKDKNDPSFKMLKSASSGFVCKKT
jgi:hypothetical protein